LRIFDAATICIALVICAVLLIERILRRKSRGLCIINIPKFQKSRGQIASADRRGKALRFLSPGLFELLGCGFYLSG
jgi:hypothetical protein